MYATCLFCQKPLGANELLEAFPVGRRLAFDAAKGRLWVVCPACERWNLSPLEERWEVIEACERLFRATRLRTSTENVGLARLPEGLELVRIGAPLRPEFAAWRYGDQFGRRRRNLYIRGGVGLGALVLLNVGGAAAGIALGGFAGVFASLGSRFVMGAPDEVVARLRLAGGRELKLQRRQLKNVNLFEGPGGHLAVQLPEGRHGRLIVSDDEAWNAVKMLLPAINRTGAGRRHVAAAVRLLADVPDAAGFVAYAARHATATHAQSLRSLPYPLRLGLEMATHEESERRALEGELATLEEEWRRADELASISDQLTLPAWVGQRLEALKRRHAERPPATREPEPPTRGSQPLPKR